MMLLVSIGFRVRSFQFLLQKKGKYPLIEFFLLGTLFLLYLSFLLYRLNFWQSLLFILIHQALFGLYMSSIFAPNHKGMPVLNKESRLGFLQRQVLTTRNVKGGPLTDFLYGGLNYQIEHHLFPLHSFVNRRAE